MLCFETTINNVFSSAARPGEEVVSMVALLVCWARRNFQNPLTRIAEFAISACDECRCADVGVDDIATQSLLREQNATYSTF